ncbi:hypothetical protein Tco_0458639 [Tanacetum coccineum]
MSFRDVPLPLLGGTWVTWSLRGLSPSDRFDWLVQLLNCHHYLLLFILAIDLEVIATWKHLEGACTYYTEGINTSELEASVDKLFDEGGSGGQTEQGDSASGGHGVGILTVSETAEIVAEDATPV